MYALLADLIVLLHALFIAFVLFGQVFILTGWAMRWQWTRLRGFRISHLLAIGYVVAQTWLGQHCPLTIWEKALRIKAGQSTHDMSFIGYWLDRLIFFSAPGWVFTAVYSGFFLVVLLSYIFYPPRKRAA